MFEKWFNRKNKDENVKPDPVIEEKNKIIVEDEKPDKVETKKFKFSNEQVSMFSSNNEIIRKEIFNINSNFTKVIHAIDRKLSANDRYNINYGDIRILYEELINLTILKFITSSQLAKNLYTTNNDLKNKLLNTDPDNNKCIIDFNEGLLYDDEPISNYMSILEFRDYMKDVDKSIDTINTCMNNIVNIEVNVGLKELNKKDFNINEYMLLFNQQLHENITKIIAVSNMCKNEYIRNSIKNYKAAQEIK